MQLLIWLRRINKITEACWLGGTMNGAREMCYMSFMNKEEEERQDTK